MKRGLKNLTTFEELEKELKKDPEFIKASQKVEQEFLLAKTIIDLRRKKNLSQAQLAKKIGTKQPVISRLERGTVKPSVSLLERVAQALNASLEIKLLPR